MTDLLITPYEVNKIQQHLNVEEIGQISLGKLRKMCQDYLTMWNKIEEMKNDKTHLTAISRKRRSAPAAKLQETGYIKGTVLDYGCGYGHDVDFYGNATGYDPNFQLNPTALTKKYDTVVCTYVANVLSATERQRLYHVLRRLATGNVFMTVRRDIKKEGFTKKGTYQETVYVSEETNAELLWENSKYATYRLL